MHHAVDVDEIDDLQQTARNRVQPSLTIEVFYLKQARQGSIATLGNSVIM